MTTEVTVALIVAASTIIQTLIARSNHMATTQKVDAVEAKVDDTHKAINGRMDQLVAASKAQGAADQRAESRQDAKDALG